MDKIIIRRIQGNCAGRNFWPGLLSGLVLFSFLFSCLAVRLPAQEKKKEPPKVNPRELTASLIGHAHIDLSWLWLWEESVHEVGPMTFWGTLRQMARLPGLTFAQSQAAIYEAMEQKYPDLFQEIKKKVKEGTWIPVGGMWVEPDLNMPDGESLARQLLYGKRYFLDKFGVDVRVGWNPDSFGHNWQLPQILKKAGLDYYVFERCAPGNTAAFWWEGQDGSRLLAYVPPGWYLVNLKNGVRDLLLKTYQNTPIKDFMLLYGAGDHGGGPRDSDVEAILKFRNDPNHPRFEFVNPENYFRKIEKLRVDYPLVRRELNFAFPGCYTTQVETKKFNRRLENLLLEAEKFSSLARLTGARDYYPDRDLDEAWKIVLRNQFHDILDGSSIGPVYEEVMGYYREAEGRGRRALDFSLETISNLIDTRGEGWPLVVYNSLPWERSEPVEVELMFPRPVQGIKILDIAGTEIPSQVVSVEKIKGEEPTTDCDKSWRKVLLLFIAKDVPSLGYKTFRAVEAKSAPKYKTSLSASKSGLENEFIRLELDQKTGWWKSLYDKKLGREFLAGAGNVLEAIADEPPNMSAWEIGLKDTLERLGEKGTSVELVEKGPVRATIRVRHQFRNSEFVQDVQLYAGLPRVDIRMWLDWQERNVMVKAAFPVALEKPAATFEIPFGAINRPADGTEVPAIKWIDLSDGQGQAGLSLLNDSHYGFDVKDNVMRMSVIRGATYPDPEADRGSHELAYSLYPHGGTWKEGLSFRRAMEFNSPLRAHQAMIHHGTLEPVKSFLRVSRANVVLTAFKKETGYGSPGFVLRLYEIFGQETEVKLELPKEMEVYESDLIERPGPQLSPKTATVNCKLKPYEIKTVVLR
ncbi:MAG: Alpha-mannosidase [Candidatus Saccharicenans subterraneus]|uniref:Alpha-mannosidase n=1 Tax=Candidatus Saccharicenans subterraneus TaxID=2508984 RepID=A0A3E2BQZ6_9BACT|nr:MAG: Alpha-mannosidase [Candidatus Saccharicenans subterraneum]